MNAYLIVSRDQHCGEVPQLNDLLVKTDLPSKESQADEDGRPTKKACIFKLAS
ncbi:hypothetical protein Bca52824_094937 [Brassica carinata]|uniref:Uncharacterized protein n=1 Tax=Brassica carinata TaxID=52824 RepID=A0A8X7NZS8_BRACI|nr:hypothetical protein Bca52824_094937 [Brassica carinata]